MKKKILAVSLAVALLAIVMVSGTLAWFSDEDTVTNTFTVGGIDIFQHEHQENEEGVLEDFDQDQYLLPVVDETDPAADANYIQKLVSVENIGVNDAYVRTHIAIPTALVPILHFELSDSENWTPDFAEGDTLPTAEVEGVEYTVYSYTYDLVLAKGDVTDRLLEGVWLDASVDIKENADGVRQFCTWNETENDWDFYDYDFTQKVKVLVATQGCQSDGFENGAANALDTVFPDIPDFTAVES